MSKLLSVLLLLGLAPVFLRAQINESDTLLLQYHTSLTGSWQTGNLDAVSLRAKADISLAPTAAWAFKTQHAYRYQAFYGRKADHDYAGRNFIYLWPRRRIYPFVLFFPSANYRRKIDFRQFGGAGVSAQLLRQPGQTIKVSLSGVYETTHFAGSTYNDADYDGDERIDTWRATLWLFGKHRLFNGRVRAFYEAFFQPSLGNAGNFRWQAEASLEWPLWKGFSFTANYLFTHENVVIRSVKPDDGLLTFGLAWNGKLAQP